MTDPKSCDFNNEYAKNSLEDSKCLKISTGFFKPTQFIGNKWPIIDKSSRIDLWPSKCVKSMLKGQLTCKVSLILHI